MQTNFNPAGATATGSQYNSGSPTEGGNEYHVANESGNNQLRLHVNPDGSSELFRKTESGWESIGVSIKRLDGPKRSLETPL